jgi:hypothetical protein
MFMAAAIELLGGSRRLNDSDERQAPLDEPRTALKELGRAAVFMAVAVGGAMLALRSLAPGPKVEDVATRKVSSADYIGARSCSQCHPGESASHAQSGHARTLRPGWMVDVARWLDGRTSVDPERPGSSWTYALRENELVASRAETGKTSEHTLDYALGSGTHAVTFLGLTGRDAEGRALGLEHRLTYFADRKAMGVTPGQEAGSNPIGRSADGHALTADETAKCLGCHATRLSTDDQRFIDPAALMPDVSCERCHGPGRSHVEAARRGEKALRMPFGASKTATAEVNVRLCGECHRLPEFVPRDQLRPDNAALARFQPVGLMQSKCYTRSNGALSCSTCHDPHAPTSRDKAGYESACLSCHSAPPQHTCPVSPQSDCLTCHMPPRDSGNGLLFSDHWIRPPVDGSPPPPASGR